MENAAILGWKRSMTRSSSLHQQLQDQPNFWTKIPELLETQADVRLVKIGSGADVFADILTEIEQAREEIVLVTCFWARSETSNLINSSLRRLSRRAEEEEIKIRVRICCSSISVWQKLFHTRSLQGNIYGSETWQKTFGLPAAHELPGLDMEIKSIFVLPVIVMHSKSVIIDRERVFLPSCNVSWESWLEGCVELTGPITGRFVTFWQSFWAQTAERSNTLSRVGTAGEAATRALFLPSPHQAWSLFDGFRRPTSPPTPLNLFLLSMLAMATQTVYLQTPNMTSSVVLSALVETLARGVGITIVTSERLMILEQIVTARTTTARSVQWLIKQHRGLLRRAKEQAEDLELLTPKPGSLRISYYEPRLPSDPVQSHIKVSIADDNIIVLGSGNLDRASWVTSQELGVAILDHTFVMDFRRQLDEALQGRLKQVYPP